jgi:hypothetical protein
MPRRRRALDRAAAAGTGGGGPLFSANVSIFEGIRQNMDECSIAGSPSPDDEHLGKPGQGGSEYETRRGDVAQMTDKSARRVRRILLATGVGVALALPAAPAQATFCSDSVRATAGSGFATGVAAVTDCSPANAGAGHKIR